MWLTWSLDLSQKIRLALIDSFLKIFEAGLSIWETAQSRKYMEAVLDLKQKRQKELDKENPDYNKCDYYERCLYNLAELCSTQIKRSKTKDMQE